jgi:hypothetical protein
MKNLDRAFGWLLILAACGHTVGTFLWVPLMSGLFVWSLGASLAGVLLGVLNIVRAGRPADKTLALITAVGTTLWAALSFLFSISIHNLLDPRPLSHEVISAVLVVFSLQTYFKESK